MENKTPFLSGCVLYLLLRKATLPDASPRQHQEGVKDEHKNPIFMADLVYTFTGVQTIWSSSDTSNYREGKLEGSINVPFNDTAYISAFDDTVKNRYKVALNRVCDFVKWHLNPEMRGWFVKACLDIIENDEDIDDADLFYCREDGSPMSKAELKTESEFELQPFLLGVLHYVLTHRADQNERGIATLDANSTKVKYKERRYSGHLGDGITRTVSAALYEQTENEEPDVLPEGSSVSPEPEVLDEQSDDEVINGAVLRAGKTLLSAFEAVEMPKINTEAMAGGLATFAAAFEAQKHSMAEEIRKNSRSGEASSGSVDPDTDEEADAEPVQEDKKTTIIQQQTNVIQNGDNNVNVTNNGTINFNF